MIGNQDQLQIEFNSWLAGFIDGEGCIRISKLCFNRKRKRWRGYQVVVSITNTFKPVMLEIYNKLGGTFDDNPDKGHPFGIKRKKIYVVRWTNKGAQEVIREVLPYLKVKQEQAKLVLLVNYVKQGIRIPTSEMKSRKMLYQLVKRLNQ